MTIPLPPKDLAELKKALKEAGFQIYEMRLGRVSLAERVRDNLILDSGVSVGIDPGLNVRVALRAQMLHFPGKTSDEAHGYAEGLATPFVLDGYERDGSAITRVLDPAHPERSLDTVHEVFVQKATSTWSSTLEALRAALELPRASSDEPPSSLAE